MQFFAYAGKSRCVFGEVFAGRAVGDVFGGEPFCGRADVFEFGKVIVGDDVLQLRQQFVIAHRCRVFGGGRCVRQPVLRVMFRQYGAAVGGLSQGVEAHGVDSFKDVAVGTSLGQAAVGGMEALDVFKTGNDALFFGGQAFFFFGTAEVFFNKCVEFVVINVNHICLPFCIRRISVRLPPGIAPTGRGTGVWAGGRVLF